MIYKSYKAIDKLGRIVIPKDFRKALMLEIGDSVILEVEDGRIIISKAEERCVFCGKTEVLARYMDKSVCASCLKALNNA